MNPSLQVEWLTISICRAVVPPSHLLSALPPVFFVPSQANREGLLHPDMVFQPQQFNN